MPFVGRARASDTSRKAAVILGPDGRGDLGWNDLAWNGGNLAKKQGVVEDFKLFTTTENEALSLLTDIASSNEYRIIVSATSYVAAVLPEVSNQYPEQNYAQLDIYPEIKESDPGYKGVLGLKFAQEQMSAQAGVLAAFLAAHHDFAKAGIVLGTEIAALFDFEIGYKWGVDWGVEWLKANKPDVLKGKKIEALKQNERVLWTYAGVWGDPAKGKAATQIQFQQGAGIVYQVAGGTGLGVLAAADDAHKAGNIPIGRPPFAIGVDSDQGWINPYVITSGLKRVDLATLNSIKLAMDGKFRDAVAAGKGVMWMTLANGGVGLANEQTLVDALQFAKDAGSLTEDKIPGILARNKELRAAQPDWIWPTLDQLGTDIKAGKVEVPKPSADPEKWGIKKMRAIYG
ncbi:MAG: BMP family ABC transporter substrate-binding protein [Dongiaceae bacterium]